MWGKNRINTAKENDKSESMKQNVPYYVYIPLCFFLFSFCAVFSCSGNRLDAALVSRHKELQGEVCDLTEAEEQLDELISKCNLQLRLLTEDPQNKKYLLDQDQVA